MTNFEFGVYSLGERIPDAQGHVKSANRRHGNVSELYA